MGFWDDNPDLIEPGGVAGPAAQGTPVGPDGQPAAPTQTAAPAPAFDPSQQVGHNGTLNGMNREQYRDAWMSSGVSNPDQAKAWLAKNGGTWQADNGTAMTPFGESMDMLFNARGSAQTGSGAKPIWGGGGGGPAPAQMSDGSGMVAGGPGGMPGGGAPGGGFAGYGGGGGSTGRTYDGPDFSYDPIAGAPTYTPTAVGGPQAWNGPQMSTPDALTLEQLQAADPFKATTADDMKADPGYAFRRDQTLGALQNMAAAKGMLRHTNTAQGLMDKAGEMASQEFANTDTRRFRDYTTALQDRYNVGTANNASKAQAYDLSTTARQRAESTNAGNSLSAWQAYQGMRGDADRFNAGRTDTAAQQNFANRFTVDQANRQGGLSAFQANTNAKLGFGNLDLGFTQAGNAYSLGQGQLALGNKSADQNFYLGNRGADTAAYSAQTGRLGTEGNLGLGWANYGLNANQQQFNQGYSLADMGLRAGGLLGGAATSYGNNAGNYATGAGNAAASGMVGSSNAWNQGLTGAANAGLTAYGQYLSGKQDKGGFL